MVALPLEEERKRRHREAQARYRKRKSAQQRALRLGFLDASDALAAASQAGLPTDLGSQNTKLEQTDERLTEQMSAADLALFSAAAGWAAVGGGKGLDSSSRQMADMVVNGHPILDTELTNDIKTGEQTGCSFGFNLLFDNPAINLRTSVMVLRFYRLRIGHISPVRSPYIFTIFIYRANRTQFWHSSGEKAKAAPRSPSQVPEASAHGRITPQTQR